jgi:hypothetical protein
MGRSNAALIEDAGTTSSLSPEELQALRLDDIPLVSMPVAGDPLPGQKPGDPLPGQQRPGDPMAQGTPRQPGAPAPGQKPGDPLPGQRPNAPCLGDPMACSGKPR